MNDKLILGVIGLFGLGPTAPGGALPFKLSVWCFSMCFLLSEPRYARSLFLSTSPVKGGDNDKAFEKKIRSQHTAAIAAANKKKEEDFLFKTEGSALAISPAYQKFAARKCGIAFKYGLNQAKP